MGKSFSKEQRHRSHKIDPRDERQQQYQQPQQYPQPLSAQTQPHPATAPTGKRRTANNNKILPEYRLHITCLDCTQRNETCHIIPNLSVNVLDPRRRYAYRNAANTSSNPRPWTLAIDCCSRVAQLTHKDKAAEEVLRHFCGGVDRAYDDDVGMGSTYGAGGLRSHGFAWRAGKGAAAAAAAAPPPETGPFRVDDLLAALEGRKVKFESSV